MNRLPEGDPDPLERLQRDLPGTPLEERPAKLAAIASELRTQIFHEESILGGRIGNRVVIASFPAPESPKFGGQVFATVDRPSGDEAVKLACAMLCGVEDLSASLGRRPTPAEYLTLIYLNRDTARMVRDAIHRVWPDLGGEKT